MSETIPFLMSFCLPTLVVMRLSLIFPVDPVESGVSLLMAGIFGRPSRICGHGRSYCARRKTCVDGPTLDPLPSWSEERRTPQRWHSTRQSPSEGEVSPPLIVLNTPTPVWTRSDGTDRRRRNPSRVVSSAQLRRGGTAGVPPVSLPSPDPNRSRQVPTRSYEGIKGPCSHPGVDGRLF